MSPSNLDISTYRGSTLIGFSAGSSLKSFDFRTKASRCFETWSETRMFSVIIGLKVLIATDYTNESPLTLIRLLEGLSGTQIYEVSIRFPVKRIVHADGIYCVIGEKVVGFYRTSDGSLIKLQPTCSNSSGCGDITSSAERVVMCFPGLQRGTLRIERRGTDSSTSSVIAAHESALQAIGLSGNGAYVATVSDMGSVIRVHSTIEPCDLLVELRRTSLLRAPKVTSIFLSSTGSFVGTVDKETFVVSIFKTPISETSHLVEGSRDESSPLAVFNSIASVCQKCLGSSAWASFKVPSMNSKILKVSASFGPDPYTVVVGAISSAGPVGFLYRFDPRESNTITLARCEFMEGSKQEDDVDLFECTKPRQEDGMMSADGSEEWTFLDSSEGTSISW